MTGATWWSQPVAAEGSTASEGIRRQLGKPNLDPLTVLIRETAQNSCDAALPGDMRVDFAVRLNQLSGNRLQAWRDFLLPEPDGSGLGLNSALTSMPRVLTIADRGTTGLGGPLRADEVPVGGERPDFVNFIRNVGERKMMRLGGGSYGFGKGILYNVSRCHVVVADSVCAYQGRLQRRLIGTALGDGYTHAGRPYTGRHWLGPIEESFARPLIDDEAAEMSARLGLPRFEDGVTGTSVAIVDVDLGRPQGRDDDRDADEAAQFIVSTMLWNLWPRMLSDHKNRLVCSMRRDGFVTEVPDPESCIELKPFIDAYRSTADGGEYEVPLRRQQPQQIGRFAISRAMAPMRTDPLLAAAAPFEGRAHHCARMRQADLIVDYVTGETPVDEAIQYGAVFRASREADGLFAEAEPPTHDDWVLTGLRGPARGVVQLAGTFIRDRLNSETQSPADASGASDTPLGFLASRLSGLMAGADGDSATASGPENERNRPSRSANATPRFVEGPALVDEDGSAVVRAVVLMPTWVSDRSVVVDPMIVLDSGMEAPDGSPGSPMVLGWRGLETGQEVSGPRLIVDHSADRRWEVRVSPATDAVVRLKLTTSEVCDST